MKKIIDTIKTIYIISTIIALLTCQVLRTYKTIKMIDCANIIVVIGIVGLLIYILDKIILRKIDKYDIIMLLLIIFAIISTVFSINTKTSLIGFNNRNEGLLVIITYYLIFLLSHNIKNQKYKKAIIITILIYGSLHCIYGILQYFKVKKIFSISILRYRYYSSGFENNPNFLSSIVSICLSLSLTTFMINNKKVGYIYFIPTVILFMGLLTCGAMSGSVAFIITIPILLLIILIKRDKKNKTFLKLALVVVSFFACFKLFNIHDKNYLLSQLNKTGQEFNEITKGNIQDSYGTGRIHIWKEGIEVAKENLVHGIGIDNFFDAKGKDYKIIDIKSGFLVDKAHNEYLQRLVTEGIFSLLTYLLLLIVIFILSIKNIIKNLSTKNTILIPLFIAFIAYCIQAFFNISVICVAPIYYIVMGLLASEAVNEKS